MSLGEFLVYMGWTAMLAHLLLRTTIAVAMYAMRQRVCSEHGGHYPGCLGRCVRCGAEVAGW